jgi:hypothetical protein
MNKINDHRTARLICDIELPSPPQAEMRVLIQSRLPLLRIGITAIIFDGARVRIMGLVMTGWPDSYRMKSGV